MDVKQILGLVFTLGGAGGLVYGVLQVFNDTGAALEGTAWAAMILGGVFFFAGIGLLKSSKPAE